MRRTGGLFLRGVRFLSVAPLAIALAYASVLPLGYFMSAIAHRPAAAWAVLTSSDTFGAALRTISALFILTPLELGLGALISFQLARMQRPAAWAVLLTLPLFMGPSYSALLWKLLLDPVNGAPSATARLGFVWDWTASPISSLAVVTAVQGWSWSLAIGAVLYGLANDDVVRGRRLFELDGHGAFSAHLESIWAARRTWLVLLAAATVIENLRTFEAVYVLTQGGPGTSTTTLQWSIFELSYIVRDTSGASGLSLLLMAVCAVTLLQMAWIVRWLEQRSA